MFRIQCLCLCCDPRVLFGWFMPFFPVLVRMFHIQCLCLCFDPRVLVVWFMLFFSVFVQCLYVCCRISISSACACVVTQEFCLACSCHFFLSLLVFHIQRLCLCCDPRVLFGLFMPFFSIIVSVPYPVPVPVL